MFRKFYTTILLLLFTFSFAMAQAGGGRLSGKVIDKQTKEALIGANIIVEGTTYGAATDVNGEFLISQVPAGTYTIQASYIGYQSQKISNVTINSGLTTSLDYELESTEFATGEVVIVAKKPLIEKSATNAIRVVSSEDLNNLPTRSLASIVALQPGVVMLNGYTYIRGSRADETGYTVEGADVKNVISRNGGSYVTVTPDAVQEIQVQAGGYTAQYGNANAGIVSQDFKTGGEQYHASARFETDDFGNYPGKKALGTYSYGYRNYVLTLSGPIFTNKLKLFVSGEGLNMKDRTPTFFTGNPTAYSDGALFDTTKVYDTGINGGNTNDYKVLTWRNGNLYGRKQDRYTLNSTLVYDNNPLILRLAAAFTNNSYQAGTFDVRNIFNLDRTPQLDRTNLLLNLKSTYLVSTNSYFIANISYLDYRNKQYDPIFEDNVMGYYDSLQNADQGYQFRTYTAGPAVYDFYGFPFYREGTVRTGYYKDHNNYLSGKVDYTAQIQKHSIKAGASYQRWTIRHFDIDDPSSLLNVFRSSPDLLRSSDSLEYLIGNSLYRSVHPYGYDIFGSETNNDGWFGAKHPVFASGYIEDRFEISDVILNLGLRYDYINMDTWKWNNPGLPRVNDKTNLPSSNDLVKGDSYNYLSPRIGFSFPISDRTVFHLQYGNFVQAPSLDLAYKSVFEIAEVISAANLISDPVAFNPKPERTTSYEVGFAQQFTDFAAMDITAFYKNITNQLQYFNEPTDPGAAKSKYATFINQDFATSKGLELSLKIRRVERVAGQVNYTYSNSSGTDSFVGSGVGSVESNNETPTVVLPLNYNYTHSGNVSLDYRFGKDDGGPILEQLGLNLLLTFNSGHPFTYARFTGLGQASAWTGGLIPSTDSRNRRPQGPINSPTTPWQFNLDFRIDKTISIADFDFNIYLYITNLLNTKNNVNVYEFTGNAYDDGFLQSQAGEDIVSQPRYTERFADLYRSLNLENRQSAQYTYGYDLFGAPRQMRLGILVNF